MDKKLISYTQTGYFSKIITDYINEEPFLKDFYKHPVSIDAFQQVITEKSKQTFDRIQLAEIIHQQQSQILLHENVRNNINLLHKENTFCLVTAHQLNIFSGPLYVIYKTISTINACKLLGEKFPAFNFIPVFWLGSEDHDLNEINHIEIFNNEYTWKTDQNGACGRMRVEGIVELLQEIKTVLGENEYAKEISAIFETSYNNSNNLAHATRNYLYKIFGHKGLVVVDGDDTLLKKQCHEIISDELFNHTSYKIVSETNEKLQKKYTIQANPREINLFYLKGDIRERIIFEDNLFKVINTDISFTNEAMQAEVTTHPEYFSPNVILRPVFQQKVLPCLAYIGGGGELAYWLQLAELFNHYSIPFPLLLLRNSALLIDDSASAKLGKLNLTAEDLFHDEDKIIKDYIVKNSTHQLSLNESKDNIENIYSTILKQAIAIEPTLEKAVLAEKQAAINSVEKIEGKLIKAQKLKEEIAILQIKTLRNKLFPDKELQERKDNVMQYYTKFGKNLIDELYKNLNPFEIKFTILTKTDKM